MDTDSLRRDPIGTILEMPGDSAQIIADPVYGYDRVIPTAGLLSDMGQLFANEITKTDDAYEAIWKKLSDDEKAYEAASVEGALPIIPLVKRIINQQHAWTTTAIISKNPIVSVKPLDGGSYTIPAQLLSDPQSASTPGSMYDTQTLSAADAANLYEQYLQYKFTEKLPFEQLLEDTVMSIHVGEAPTWWKVYYDPRMKNAKVRQFAPVAGSTKATYMGVVDTTVKDGESVRIAHVSNRMVTMPVDGGDDEQASPWVAEKDWLTNSQLWEGVKNKNYDFCRDKKGAVDTDLVEQILGFAQDPKANERAPSSIDTIDFRVAQQPNDKHEIRTLWFFWPIKVKKTSEIPTDQPPGEDGKIPTHTDTQEVIEIRSLCGTLHMASRQFLNLYVNPYWHGKRPLVPFFMRKRPHRFSGTTTAGDLAPLANLISSVYHLQIQNGVQQNMKIFPIRQNSVTWNFMKRNGNQLKPGLILPFEDKDDFNPVQLGAPIASMAAEIEYLNTEAERLGVVNDYDLGADVPNRTAAMTVGQIQQMAKMQPQTILRAVRRSISKAVEMYLSTISQYHVLETIPFLDDETNKLIQMLISFPQDAIENHFSFHVTATGDEDTSQARVEKLQLILDATDKANEAAMKLSDGALDPEAPPPAREFNLKLLLRREQVFRDLLMVNGPQYGKLALTEKVMRELQGQADQYAQQKAAEAAANPQKPAEPHIDISLKGVIPPDQEMAIIQQAMPGIQPQPPQPQPPQGDMNGQAPQLPPPVGGGDLSQVLPGAPGPGGVQPQPPDQGVPVPGPSGDIQQGGPPVGIGQ